MAFINMPVRRMQGIIEDIARVSFQLLKNATANPAMNVDKNMTEVGILSEIPS